MLGLMGLGLLGKMTNMTPEEKGDYKTRVNSRKQHAKMLKFTKAVRLVCIYAVADSEISTMGRQCQRRFMRMPLNERLTIWALERNSYGFEN